MSPVPKMPFLIILLIYSAAQGLPAQDPSLPSWVLYGLGKRAYENRAFDEAVQHFREAVRRRGIYPEAEWMLGRSLAFGGDQTLARRQYERALAQKDLLQVPGTRYEILYELARLASSAPGPDKEKIRQGELDYLLQILKDDRIYQQAFRENLLGGYNRALLEPGFSPRGLDKVLLLYRGRLEFSLEAHRRAAEIYLEAGAYNKSLNHILLVIISLYTELSERYRDLDPLYQYTGLEDLHQRLFQDFQVHTPFQKYLADQKIWQILDLAAGALGGIASRLTPETPEAEEEYQRFYSYLGLGGKTELLDQLALRGGEMSRLRTDLVRKLLAAGIVPENIY